MGLFELVIALLLAGAVLTTVAQRIGAPYPAMLALAGVVLAFAPANPATVLDPELALALFVAPVLLTAAYEASPRDLWENRAAVTGLVLVAVGLTVVAVAVVARLLVPQMPWAVALVLGAIVAPPDASAATAVLRQLSPPHRMMVVLEGESLLNDASALLIYRVALSAVGGVSISAWHAAGIFTAACLGGALLGFVLARAFQVLCAPVTDIAVLVMLEFVGTFSVWLLGQWLGVSPIITVIAYAMTLAQFPARNFTAEIRRASVAVWGVVVFVLNALAFILVGLQLRLILLRLDGRMGATIGFAAVILVTVIVVRFAWVMGYSTIARWEGRRFGSPPARPPPPVRASLAVSWCGMRGIVTLAAALALPDGSHGTAFPFRDLVIAASYAVVVGTLVLQGLTLGPLLRRLRLSDDGAVEREVALARSEVIQTARRILAAEPGEAAASLLAEFSERQVGSRADFVGTRYALHLRLIAEQRATLARLRAGRTIGDDAYRRIEEELDWAEGNAIRQIGAAGASV